MPKPVTVYVMNYGRAKFLLQWKDPVTGRRKSKTSEHSKRRAAEQEAFELEKLLNSRLPRGDGSLEFSHFIEIYEEKHLDSLSDGGKARSLGVLSVFEELMSPTTLASVTGSMLTDYAAALRKTPIRKRTSASSKPRLTAKPQRFHSESNIATHMRTLRAALGWAKENGYITEIPPIPKQARARKTRAKGRPLTWPEFVRLVRSTRILECKFRRTYRRLIIGLWLSGLRLDEALVLTWGTPDGHATELWVDMSGKRPLLGIVAESEKGFEDRLLPITPDFGRWLLKIPEPERTGWVFPLEKHRWKDTRTMRWVSRVISQIGEASGVVVNAKGKTASAHDLRRTYGLRWSMKVMPAELQVLMRHSSISTTMSYYVQHEAATFAERLWAAESAGRTTSDTTPENDASHTKRQNP